MYPHGLRTPILGSAGDRDDEYAGPSRTAAHAITATVYAAGDAERTAVPSMVV